VAQAVILAGGRGESEFKARQGEKVRKTPSQQQQQQQKLSVVMLACHPDYVHK
jgi:hypothetical protein